jgi:hypothetical protein
LVVAKKTLTNFLMNPMFLVMRNLFFLVALAILPACDVEPVMTADRAVTAQDWCTVLVQAQQDMRERCGYDMQPGYHYVDCATVVAVRDIQGLQDACLPALASECVNGDTPVDWQCHQLVFPGEAYVP